MSFTNAPRQPRIREDDRQRVYAPPVSSSKSSGTSTSKEVPPLSRTRNVPPTRPSQDTASDPSFGLHKTEELSSVPRVGSSRDKNAIKHHAQQVDRTISVQPSAKPSIHSAPPLNRPGISTSSSLSRIAPAITKPTSSWMPAPRGMPSDEPHTRPGEAPSELSRPPDQGKGNTYPDQQSHSNPSAASYRPPLPSECAITKAESPLPPKPESGPHRLGRSKSRINEGVEREVTMRDVEPPTSEKKERKLTVVAEERETYREDSATGSYGASHREAESTPPSSHGSHVKRYPQAPPESSVERTSTLSRESDSGLLRLPDAGKTRGKVDRPADLAPSLDRRATSTSPPASLSTRNQPKHVIGVPSNNASTNSGANHPLQPPNVLDDSQLRTAPSMSRSMTSRSFAPSASRSTQREEQGSQPQHGRLPSESQPSQYESRGAPSNEQSHAVPNTTARGDLPSAEHPSPTGTPSRFHVRPFSGYLLTPADAEGITEQTIALDLDLANFRPGGVPNLGHHPPPPPYEPKAPQRVSSTQGGTSSRPSMGISREVRNESTTTSGNISSIFSSPPLGSQRINST